MNTQTLRDWLNYTPTTGVFTWVNRPANRVHIGDVAGSLTADGYRIIRVAGVAHLAHRLAWLWVHGELPTRNIDHINGVRDDNRIDNLRDVPQADNCANRHKPRADAEGEMFFSGVRWIGHETGYRRKGGKAGTNLWPWLVKHHRDGKTIQRTAPDLLTAVALKRRMQLGGDIPARCRKGDVRRIEGPMAELRAELAGGLVITDPSAS